MLTVNTQLHMQDPMVSELIESGYIFVLPEPDPQGRKVLFSVARKLDPERHNTSHVVRAHIATFEVRERERGGLGWDGVAARTGFK